jgi:tetratricopeptide (TPR) repeat protein
VAEIDLLKRTINESSELSKRGENQRALKLLDDAIAEAIRENRSIWVCTLSRHASVIADEMGDLHLVRRYREQCLVRDPDNPFTLSSLADVLHRQGEDDLARQFATKSYRLSMQRDTELDRALVESLLKTWPDIQN